MQKFSKDYLLPMQLLLGEDSIQDIFVLFLFLLVPLPPLLFPLDEDPSLVVVGVLEFHIVYFFFKEKKFKFEFTVWIWPFDFDFILFSGAITIKDVVVCLLPHFEVFQGSSSLKTAQMNLFVFEEKEEGGGGWRERVCGHECSFVVY